MRRRERLRVICALMGFVALFVGTVVLARRGQGSSAVPGGVDIGLHPNYDEAMRAALSRIGEDMRREPNARKFVVWWSMDTFTWLHVDDIGRKCLEYDRHDHRLRDSDDGGECAWDGVSEAMIRRAARAKSPFDAFRQYGCPEWP